MGSTRCKAHRDQYLASFWSFFPEQCWLDTWAQHVSEGLLAQARCRTQPGPGPWRQSWCIANVEQRSACGATAREPAAAPFLRSSAARC
eukprot:2471393-Prymnesium_polylepis.1